MPEKDRETSIQIWKLKIEEVWKLLFGHRTTGVKRALQIAYRAVLCIFLLNIIVNIFKHYHWLPIHKESCAIILFIYHSIQEPFVLFVEHFWIEILSGVFIAKLIDKSLEGLAEIPRQSQERNHNELLTAMTVATNSVRILDTSIYSFVMSNNFDETFKKLISTLQRKKHESRIKILLLHPDSLGAEQRNIDLDNLKTPHLEKMKLGIAKLIGYSRQWESNTDTKKYIQNIEIKLYRTSPLLIFTSWDNHMDFGILRPNTYADESTFRTTNSIQLANHYNAIFEELWEDDQRSMKLEDYTFVKLKHGNNTLNKFYWGGDTDNVERPMFIVNKENVAFEFKTGKAEKDTIQIIHNNSSEWATLELINKENDKYFYEFAKKQIEDNYGEDSLEEGIKLKFNASNIYRIKYNNKFRINLKESNVVHQQLENKGIAFASHRDFDINLGNRVDDLISRLNNCFLNIGRLTKPSTALPETNQSLRRIQPPPDGRKRIFAKYKCTIEDWEINITADPCDSYPASNKIITSNLHKLIQKATINDSYLEPLEKNIVSTIKADLWHIFGHKQKIDHKEETKHYTIYVHLIQTRVSKNEKATPQIKGEEKIDNLYLVVHLISKRNIIGGFSEINQTKNGITSKTMYNVHTPLDTLFIKSHTQDGATNLLNVTEISFLNQGKDEEEESKLNEFKLTDESNQELGYRNVLVIEIRKEEKTKNQSN